jgi:hypothetical protein
VRLRGSALVLIFILIITLPYIYAVVTAGPDHVFGGFLYNPIDGNTYLAKIYQGWRGDWRFTLPYTAEPGEGAYLFLYYLLLGHLARLFSLPLTFTFHLARLAGALVLLLALWRFFSVFRFEASRLWWVIAMALFGSGVGWMVFPFQKLTSDFWVAEAYPFLSAYSSPHFVLSLALLLLLLILPSKKKRGPVHRLLGGLTVILAGFFVAILSPFTAAIGLVVLAGWMIWEFVVRFQHSKWVPTSPEHAETGLTQDDQADHLISTIASRFMLILIGATPVMLYDFWVARVDPILAGWNAQNLTFTPALWDVVLSLSPALIFAVAGSWSIIKHRHHAGRILLIWLVASLFLIYLPFNLQRRFMAGLFVPVVCLAGIGLGLLPGSSPRRAGWISGLVFVLSILTNVLILLTGLYGIRTHDPLLYLTMGEDQAMSWIETNAQPDALILASPQTSLFIPAHTGRRVVYGHPFETVSAVEQQQAVLDFFAVKGEIESADFLIQNGIDYVFYGPRERASGELPEGLLLSPVFSAQDVTIYQVNR